MAEDHVRDALERIDSGISKLGTSAGWQQWLRCQSRFHRYSAFNAYLIGSQCPEATQVAGFQAWRTDHGRYVRKGEHAIWILAPLTFRRTETDDETGEETTVRGVRGFRGVAVFDVSQTDGAPLPEHPARHLAGDAPLALFDQLREVARAHGYAVYEYATTTGANGFTDPAGKRIVVDPTMSPAMRCKTLAHELGHMLMHADSGGYNGTCRETAELEAESVAFIVMARAGVDASGYTFGYVATWQGGTTEARRALQASAERIARAARTIIDGVWPAEISAECAA